MELKLINDKGQATASVNASDDLFGREYNESLVHQVVTAYMANARMATRAQKGRSEIAKSTRKPWRQKGTGRARAGMASSPLWRGGGKIFPNNPDENFSHKVNRKMFRAGMRIHPVAACTRRSPVRGGKLQPGCAQDQAAGRRRSRAWAWTAC